MLFKNRNSYLLNFAVILALLAGVFGGVQAVQASTLTVMNTNDSGAGSLRQAIANAISGDTVRFHASLAGQSITLSSTLIINKNLTINGSTLASQITISGNDLYRVFYINTGITITLDSLIIAHGKSPYGSMGGGIFNSGALTVTNSTISENSAAYGGGINNAGGTLTMIDSTISYNDAYMDGGGVYSQGGTVTLNNSTLSNNNASVTGGGVYNADGTLIVNNSTFSDNSGDPLISSYGGGINNAGGTVTVSDSIFSNNSAQANGGAIFHGSGTLTITNSIFSGNNAGNGGGIMNHATLNIANSAFLGNSASDAGGAIYGGETTVTESAFSGNAALDGGGIFNSGALMVTDSTFSGNGSGEHNSVGGAISNYETATVMNSTFFQNFAYYGGGFHNWKTFIVTNSTFSENVAVWGGGIANTGNGMGAVGATLTVRNSTFSANGAQYGGGIANIFLAYQNNSKLNYLNTIIANSTNGGDCYNVGDILININNIVEDGSCSASMSGDPKLAPLADNGGPTPTMALLSDSPAIDAGEDTSCPATDQRGVTRPQEAACDIGAFEAEYTLVDVTIGNTDMGSYRLVAHGSRRQSFADTNNGTVKIVHMDTHPIMAAERVIYKVGGVNTSFSEMMALPDGQLDNIYWLPWYNNVDLDTQLRFGNVSGSTATVHVYIGDSEMMGSPFVLIPGESTRKSFAGINNGPVRIESNVDIVAAERVIYKVNGTNTSFSEMMALPAIQLDHTYWLPWYNNVDLDTQLRFGNVSGSTATVHVYIGDSEMVGSPFTLGVGESTRKSFSGINNGPVRIESNVDIVAAERVIYKVNGVNTSFSEMLALPATQLDSSYWLPWYNNVDLDTQLRFGNVSASTATVHVYIGGVEMAGSPFTLGVGESMRQSFAGVNNGPVQIVSNVDIVAAERVIYKVNGTNTSFSEMMALPNSHLDSTYWLPWYNNVDLDTQLRFGVP
jgi:hypothetical protein